MFLRNLKKVFIKNITFSSFYWALSIFIYLSNTFILNILKKKNKSFNIFQNYIFNFIDCEFFKHYFTVQNRSHAPNVLLKES